MSRIRISRFLISLGIDPDHDGYEPLIYIIILVASCRGKTIPRMKDLYQEAADSFGTSRSRTEHNIRAVVHSYWAQKDSHRIFSNVMHYPAGHDLCTKEFVSVLAEYVSIHRL